MPILALLPTLCIMGKLDCVGKSTEEDKYDKCKESVFYLISANRSREVLSQCTFLSSGTSALFNVSLLKMKSIIRMFSRFLF